MTRGDTADLQEATRMILNWLRVGAEHPEIPMEATGHSGLILQAMGDACAIWVSDLDERTRPSAIAGSAFIMGYGLASITRDAANALPDAPQVRRRRMRRPGKRRRHG